MNDFIIALQEEFYAIAGYVSWLDLNTQCFKVMTPLVYL